MIFPNQPFNDMNLSQYEKEFLNNRENLKIYYLRFSLMFSN